LGVDEKEDGEEEDEDEDERIFKLENVPSSSVGELLATMKDHMKRGGDDVSLLHSAIRQAKVLTCSAVMIIHLRRLSTLHEYFNLCRSLN